MICQVQNVYYYFFFFFVGIYSQNIFKYTKTKWGGENQARKRNSAVKWLTEKICEYISSKCPSF